ncbi:hypothetical protein BJ742DRAFT_736255 [Cladochytrium replicatum]|nr:hypothetical protein BJ742DRAFT_736255 [Cladochytrium replicatum]
MSRSHPNMNFLVPKLHRTLPRIATWKIFPGDTVIVVPGTKLWDGSASEENQRVGVVSDVNMERQLVWVDGVNMHKKHLKPNTHVGSIGHIIQVPMPLHYSKVQLFDKDEGRGTPVKLVKAFNVARKRTELQRQSILTKKLFPIPSTADGLKEKETPQEWITPALEATSQSWTPELSKLPFPVPFLNQLERLKRKNKESFAL